MKHTTQFTIDLSEVNIEDKAIAGGKAASLGHMTHASLPIPAGFVVSSAAFTFFMEHNMLEEKIKNILRNVDLRNSATVESASKDIRKLILKAPIPVPLIKEILNKCSELRLKHMAVRSSATDEDSFTASWAGQLKTYLNVTEANLVSSVRKCWASLYTAPAIIYSQEKQNSNKNSVAVVIQQMIHAEVAGVCFTQNPITNDKNQLVIEAGYGLGTLLVEGNITPDRYLLHKPELIIEEVSVGTQKMIIRSTTSGTKKTKLEANKRFKQKLSGQQVVQLAALCKNIEELYEYPQDIEWALRESIFYIVQSRPNTIDYARCAN